MNLVGLLAVGAAFDNFKDYQESISTKENNSSVTGKYILYASQVSNPSPMTNSLALALDHYFAKFPWFLRLATFVYRFLSGAHRAK
jgi:hypothetical protein